MSRKRRTTKIFCAQAGLDISDSESVLLLKDGKLVDGTCGKPAPYGTAVGRVEGKDGFFFLPLDEKGKTGRHYRFIAAKPSFSKAPGVYDNLSKLKLTLDTHGYKTHFTTNGSAPTMASATYSDSIALDTTCVVRAFSEGDSTHMASPIATATYFLGEKHTLPVINISVNPNDLWDHNNGIYVEGPGASPVKPHMGANYWKKWWKKAHIEFYDGDKGFEADCGLAIFGGFSRALAKKSFKIKFKDIYGPKNVKYDIYDEGEAIKLKTMVLRSGSQDMHGVMARDEFFTSLMAPNSPTLMVQNYRPVVLYINAQYFGVYYVRDKIDKHFAARKLQPELCRGYCLREEPRHHQEGDLRLREQPHRHQQPHRLETGANLRLQDRRGQLAIHALGAKRRRQQVVLCALRHRLLVVGL